MVQLDKIFNNLERAIEIENQSRRFDELRQLLRAHDVELAYFEEEE